MINTRESFPNDGVEISRSAFNRFVYLMFPLGYAIFGMLGAHCTLIILATNTFKANLFGYVAGFFALAVCLVLLGGNIFLLYNSGHKIRPYLMAEALITFFLCPVFVILWEMVIKYLRVTY